MVNKIRTQDFLQYHANITSVKYETRMSLRCELKMIVGYSVTFFHTRDVTVV